MNPKNLFINNNSQLFELKLREIQSTTNTNTQLKQFGELLLEYSTANWGCDYAKWLRQKEQQSEILFDGEQNPLVEQLQQALIKFMTNNCSLCFDFYFGAAGCKYCSGHHGSQQHIDPAKLSTQNMSLLNMIGFAELAKRYIPLCQFENTKDCDLKDKCTLLHFNNNWQDNEYWLAYRFLNSVQIDFRDKVARQIHPREFPFIQILPRYCEKCIQEYPPL